jgi:dienelactone hydrolase
MKKIIICIAFVLCQLISNAQFPIGTSSIDFYDSSRTRFVETEIYYPGVSNGTDVNPANGQFPLIIFGHGFSMGINAYLNFVDSLVPEGYIVVLPTNEGSLSPDHGKFGEDLAFLNMEIPLRASQNSSFILYGHFNGKTAISGHSMGGGASFLAAENNNSLTTLINFAAAETNPSAISAAANITVPCLIFYAENDGVTPPVDHQIPMYQALSSSCKYSINILGGGHCNFANYNLACSSAELFTSPQPTTNRSEQHRIIFRYLKPYLKWQLYDSSAYKSIFENLLINAIDIDYENDCSSSSIKKSEQGFQIFPNPTNDYLHFSFPKTKLRHIQIINLCGQINEAFTTKQKDYSINISDYSKGIYLVRVSDDNQSFTQKFLVH